MATFSVRSEIDVSDPGAAGDVVFAPDGQVLACAYGDTVLLLSVPEMKLLKTLKAGTSQVAPSGPLRCVAFTPDGSCVAAGSARQADDVKEEESVFLWNVRSGRLVRTFSHHDKTARSVDGFGINALGFSADGKLLITGCANKTVGVWDVATGRKLRLLRGHAKPVTRVALSPDGKWIAAGDQKRDVRVWSSKTWKETRLLRAKEDWIGALTFVGSSVLGGGDSSGCFQLWDLESGNTFEQHQVAGPVTSIAYSAASPLLVVTTGSGSLTVWQRGEEQPLLAQEPAAREVRAAFGPDGVLVATAAEGSIKLWELDPADKPAADKAAGQGEKRAAGKRASSGTSAGTKKTRRTQAATT